MERRRAGQGGIYVGGREEKGRERSNLITILIVIRGFVIRKIIAYYLLP